MTSTSLRLGFAGTPSFAAASLQALLDAGIRPRIVLTQPDRPAGRGRKLTASAVAELARSADLPIAKPTSLKDPAIVEQLRDAALDLLIVVAYGLIIPPTVLALPRLGCWNVHASLLPRWRGAAPIQRAIEAGDTETGVCLMQMERGLDTGPVFRCATTAIDAAETAGELHERLAKLGAETLLSGLAAQARGDLGEPQPQDDAQKTHAAKLDKAEAMLDFSEDAQVLARRVRAFHPWPVAEAVLDDERLRIHRAQALDESIAAPPGSLLIGRDEVVDIACGRGVLRLLQVQRDGGRVISAHEWRHARRN